MEMGTRYSRACCEIIAGEGGMSGLMRLLRVLNRSKWVLTLRAAARAAQLGACAVVLCVCGDAPCDDSATLPGTAASGTPPPLLQPLGGDPVLQVLCLVPRVHRAWCLVHQ